MSCQENQKFSAGDISVTIKSAMVYAEFTIKGTTFRLTDQEARWLKDFLNKHYLST